MFRKLRASPNVMSDLSWQVNQAPMVWVLVKQQQGPLGLVAARFVLKTFLWEN